MSAEKEASGLCLFHKLHGVQVVGGSNPLTPILFFGRCRSPRSVLASSP
jgi:hypothetical protein